MVGVEDSLFAYGACVDCLGESIAFVEEVFVVGELVPIGAEVDSEVLVGLIGVLDGNGDVR